MDMAKAFDTESYCRSGIEEGGPTYRLSNR